MSANTKRLHRWAWGLTLAISGGLLVGGGLWLRNRTSTANDPTAQGCDNTRAKVQLTALGDTFSGYSTLRSSAFRSALKKSKMSLCYQDEFDQSARADAIAQGDADFIVTTLDQYLTHQPAGKVVGIIDRTIGADAIILNTKVFPQLKSLLELEKLVRERANQGQKLKMVFAGDTPSEFLALVLDIKFENFNLDDFEVVRVEDASIAWELMQSDPEIALGVLWEPFVNTARKAGHTVVLSSDDAPKLIVDVIVASDRLLEENPKAVTDFVTAYYQRIDSSLQDQDLLTRQIAFDGQVPLQDAVAIHQGIAFFTSVEAQKWMESGELEQRMDAIANILALAERLPKSQLEPEQVYTTQHLDAIAQTTAAEIETLVQNNPDLAARLQAAQVPSRITTVSSDEVQDAENIGNLTIRGEVNFTAGSAELTPESIASLTQLSREIKEFNPDTVGVKVQGHTSQSGETDNDQQLSLDRAQVVADFLTEDEVQHNIFPEGLGFSQPLPDIDPADPQNQRTAIRLIRLTPYGFH